MGDLCWKAAIEGFADAYSPQTLASRIKDFRMFADWAAGEGLSPLPAAPDTVARFLDDTMPACAVQTAQNRLQTIRWLHRMLSLPEPTADPQVKLAFRRGLRRGARPPRSAGPLSAEMRDRMIAACPPTMLGLRDRAMIAAGYDTLCRRSELVRLQIEDLQRLDGGGGKILIRRSKMDVSGRGAFGFLSASSMALVESWLTAAGLQEGFLFRTVYGRSIGAGAMEPRIVNRTLRLAGELAGIERALLDRISAHSLRVGPAQDLLRAGRSPLEIMRAGRWTSLDGMMSYVRDAEINVWADGA